MTEDPDLPKAFLAHVRDHNWGVCWAICLSVLGTAVFWPFLYFFTYTVGLVFLSVVRGPYAMMPADYPLIFTAAALASFPICLGFNWFLRRFCHHVVQQYQVLGWALELLVAPHHLTFSVVGHFRAFVILSARDLRLMVKILRTIDEQRRLEIRRLEMEVPPARRRQRLMIALSLMDLTNLTRIDERLYLVLRNVEVRKMLYPRVKISRRPPGGQRRR